MYEFKKATYVKSVAEKGDYILYYVWDAQKGALARKRKYIPVKYKTEETKKAYGKDVVKKINKLLKAGYHIDRKKTRKRNESSKTNIDGLTSFLTVEKATEKYINHCQNKLKNNKDEVARKRRTLIRFFDWASNKYGVIDYPSEITKEMAQTFSDYLIEDEGLQNKTHNNLISQVHHFFEIGQDREFIDSSVKNPFSKVDNLQTSYGEKNIPYSDKQIKKLKPYIQETDYYLWQFICFIYYALMRPSEIKRIRIKDIDLENNILRIPSAQSKSKKYDTLPLASALVKEIKAMNIQQYSQDYYLFSRGRKPSSTPMSSNYTSDKYRPIKKKFNLSEDYTIYAFKHTAVCKWYKKDKDIVRIQKMCRHTNIEMTARYLKSLSLLTDVIKIDTLPEM